MNLLSRIPLLVLLIGATRALPIGSRDALHLFKRDNSTNPANPATAATTSTTSDDKFMGPCENIDYPVANNEGINLSLDGTTIGNLEDCKAACGKADNCGGLAWKDSKCSLMHKEHMKTRVITPGAKFVCRKNNPSCATACDATPTTGSTGNNATAATNTTAGNNTTSTNATATNGTNGTFDNQFMTPKSDFDFSSFDTGNQGIDLMKSFTSIPDCMAKCVDDPYCGGFAWNKTKSECYLKHKGNMGVKSEILNVDFYCRKNVGAGCVKYMDTSSASNTTNGTRSSTTNVTAANCIDPWRLEKVDELQPLVTRGSDKIGCLRNGSFQLQLNPDGSLAIYNLQKNISTWSIPPPKNASPPFVCAIIAKYGTFTCYAGESKAKYWSTKTSIDDGYGEINSTNLHVSITDEGIFEVSV
jgi:hypothetical protein